MNTTEVGYRINELECKLQFQEDTIDSLNQALVQQQQQLTLLEEKLVLLAQQLEANRHQQAVREDDLPPHY